MSLRARIGLLTMLMVSAIVGVTLAFVYVNERLNLVERMDQERVSALEKLARISQATLDAREERILLSYLDSWIHSDQVIDVALWDLDDRIHIHSGFIKKDYSMVGPPIHDAFVQRANKSDRIVSEIRQDAGRKVLQMAVPVFSEGRRFGSTVVRYDQDVIDRELSSVLRSTLRELLLVGLGCLALCTAVSFAFAVSLTRPIQTLSRAARTIGTGEFSADIPVTRDDELGLLAQDLNRMARQLKELDEMKDRFLQSVSHNMRSPLSGMTSAVYHAQQLSGQVPAEVQEDLHIVDMGIQQLTRFINNLLDLERIRAGRMDFKFEKTDVGALFDLTLQLFERVAQEKGVKLSAQMPAGPVSAFCDKGLVSEVISNLVLNSLKFTPEGGAIQLGAADEPRGVHLTVRDTGMGIPADQIGRLFDRFVQVSGGQPPAGRPRGSGIGLAFCKEVVEAHHGKIWVESSAGRGSVFHFTLPNAEVAPS